MTKRRQSRRFQPTVDALPLRLVPGTMLPPAPLTSLGTTTVPASGDVYLRPPADTSLLSTTMPCVTC
jgi:hypothetical protein